MGPVADPTLKLERSLYRDGARYVIGCDEVGRGAIAGPIGVGVCLIDRTVGRYPVGLRDSKMLSEKRREQLAPLATKWSLLSAVGLASNEEVDTLGLTAALGLAGLRAMTLLQEQGADFEQSVVILDGSFDWLNRALPSRVRVQTRIKADRDCASVSAASVIAKVHRDRIMIEADAGTPGYDWACNKGYGSETHYAGIAELGPSDFHRRTWLHQGEVLGGIEWGNLDADQAP